LFETPIHEDMLAAYNWS